MLLSAQAREALAAIGADSAERSSEFGQGGRTQLRHVSRLVPILRSPYDFRSSIDVEIIMLLAALNHSGAYFLY